MINYLRFLENPQFNFRLFFEVMRDFRKGGLNPFNFAKFMYLVHNLPPINKRTGKDYQSFSKLGLQDIADTDFLIILKEVIRRAIEQNKTCWHPLASNTTCNIDNAGRIIYSAAHSIQNNGVLSQISEDGCVLGYALEEGDFSVKMFGKKHASIFWGFCNNHDSIFSPIETVPYAKTDEQNFLFAYRGFVVSGHKKTEASILYNFGEQSDNSIKGNKILFDQAILNREYSCIETIVIELPAFYPVAVSSCFYLDFDFEENLIKHSDERMEYIFITLLPNGNKTYFLLSYFKIDAPLYGLLGTQLVTRNNLKSDISVLIVGHTENIFFNPTYYKSYIEKQKGAFERLMIETQFDIGKLDNSNLVKNVTSITPNDYLTNKYRISLFGY
jgi:hypothetical protein